MKSIIIFTATLLALSATSCKKDKNPPPPSASLSLIKSVTTSKNGAAAKTNISTNEEKNFCQPFWGKVTKWM